MGDSAEIEFAVTVVIISQTAGMSHNDVNFFKRGGRNFASGELVKADREITWFPALTSQRAPIFLETRALCLGNDNQCL